MNKHTDNTSLAELYRRLCQRDDAPCLDAETLTAFAAGILSDEKRAQVLQVLAVSPAQADLAHMLAELAPASDVLARAAVQRSEGHARQGSSVRRLHAIGQPAPQRHVPRVRRAAGMRWFAAAAVLVAVAGVWGWQHVEAPRGAAIASATATPAPAPADTIFSSDMSHSVAVQSAKADHSDQIFSSSFHNRKRG